MSSDTLGEFVVISIAVLIFLAPIVWGTFKLIRDAKQNASDREIMKSKSPKEQKEHPDIFSVERKIIAFENTSAFADAKNEIPMSLPNDQIISTFIEESVNESLRRLSKADSFTPFALTLNTGGKIGVIGLGQDDLNIENGKLSLEPLVKKILLQTSFGSTLGVIFVMHKTDPENVNPSNRYVIALNFEYSKRNPLGIAVPYIRKASDLVFANFGNLFQGKTIYLNK
jgi:vacuolar-type H+-ATPase subunit H